MDKYSKLALSIKQARMAKGLSQEEFAELLDVSSTHVKHIESGHRKPSIDILFLICEKTGLSIDKILYDRDICKTELDLEIETLLSLCSENQKALVAKLINAILSSELC